MTTPPTKLPFSQRKMLAWLRDTAAGRHFLEGMEESQCRNCERLRDQQLKCHECDARQRMLIVCGVTPEGKAWLEAYGDAHVDVRVQQKLTTTAAGEIAAERILEAKAALEIRGLVLSGQHEGILHDPPEDSPG